MGLKKAYDELTDNPEFTEGLILSDSQAVEDINGNNRLFVYDNGTFIHNQNGKPTFLAQNDESSVRAYGSVFKLVNYSDFESGQAQVKYLTGDIGTLELSNADLNANGNDLNNVGALEADTATINGQTSEDGWEIVLSDTQSGANSYSFSVNLADTDYQSDTSVFTLRFTGLDVDDVVLSLSDSTTNDYDFTMLGGDATLSNVTTTTGWTLVDTAASSSNNVTGQYLVDAIGRPTIAGDGGVASPWTSCRSLLAGDYDGDEDQITITTTGNFSGSELTVEILAREL